MVLRVRDRRLDCLLWQRAKAPFDGQWSLPRGPLGATERLGTSASRHLAAKVDITSIAHMPAFRSSDRFHDTFVSESADCGSGG